MRLELRAALRSLARSPGFSIVAVATVAIGIGANAAVFGLVNQVLFHPRGLTHPERVVVVRARYEKLNLKSIPISAPDFANVRDSTDVFDRAALYSSTGFNYTDDNFPALFLQGTRVSEGFFDVFGVNCELGHGFDREDDQPGAAPVVVLSNAAWKRVFGGDPAIVGKTIQLDQRPYKVRGVVGPEFGWPAQSDLWVPLALPPEEYAEKNRFKEYLNAVARIRNGVLTTSALEHVQVLSNRLMNGVIDPDAKGAGWTLFAVPILDFVSGTTRTPALILIGAVGFMLLIACSNIAGLMISRTAARSTVIALQLALGSGRLRLLRGTLLEAVLLTAAGAALGVGFASLGLRILIFTAPQVISRNLSASLDLRVIALTAGVATGVAFVLTVAQIHQISRIAPASVLKSGVSSPRASGQQTSRAILVIAETALAVLLVIGAGLFTRSLAKLQEVDPGFEASNVWTAGLSLSSTKYSIPGRQAAFYRSAADRLKAIPGVSAVGFGTPIPFSGDERSQSFYIEGRVTNPGEPEPHGYLRFVSPGYFESMRIPLKRGRLFSSSDGELSEQVVVIDDILAKQYWPDSDPIGRHIRTPSGSIFSIAGIVTHVKHSDLAAETDKGTCYFSLLQRPVPAVRLIIRGNNEALDLSQSIVRAMHDFEPNQAIRDIRTLQSLITDSLATRRLVTRLMGFFAAMALFLSILGLYGVISYSVVQREREIGIRMALGASRQSVLGVIVGHSLRLSGVGLGIGFAAALIFTRLLQSQWFGIGPFDPWTFCSTAALMLLATASASYVPAMRAATIDPVRTLRH